MPFASDGISLIHNIAVSLCGYRNVFVLLSCRDKASVWVQRVVKKKNLDTAGNIAYLKWYSFIVYTTQIVWLINSNPAALKRYFR